ncbi:hypothetical protein J2X24_003075 [Asticcacaulis solisilvae]|nr:hypothetical protein [Asticcacaulis solisilvae]MDR6801542.1 hypothetical protein [Asticcacaulis sp. BE141]
MHHTAKISRSDIEVGAAILISGNSLQSGVLGELSQNVTTSKQLKLLEYFSLLFLKALKLLSIRVW